MRLNTGTLRFEISVALLVKVVLLIALWLVIFRYGGRRPDAQPGIAEHFGLPVASRPVLNPESTSTPTLETPYVR